MPKQKEPIVSWIISQKEQEEQAKEGLSIIKTLINTTKMILSQKMAIKISNFRVNYQIIIRVMLQMMADQIVLEILSI